MGIRKSVEENVAVWLLGTLLAGFLAGIGTYKGIIEIAELTTVPKAKASLAEKKESQLRQQIEFLERSLSYINARIKGKENQLNNTGELVMGARKQFAVMLERMYMGGDLDSQRAKGYEFDEIEAGNHKIIFEGGKQYRIPQDIKGDFIGRL